MMILNNWCDLSDVETEELVKESLICMRFYGFLLEDHIPDRTVLFVFCNEIVAKKAYDRLLKKINKELKKNQAIVKEGVIVETSITVKATWHQVGFYRVEEDRKEEGKSKLVKEKQG
ncbi:MAG: transposase [Flavobacteriales bacterium Tduv]